MEESSARNPGDCEEKPEGSALLTGKARWMWYHEISNGRIREGTMTRRTMIDFGADTALITAAFFVRNAAVLIGLALALLIAFSR